MMRNTVQFLFFALVCFLMCSCIKELEKEGIYGETEVSGVVVEQRSQTAVEGIRVLLTDGENVSQVVQTDGDGCFLLPVSVEELGKGYFLSVEADSLYTSARVGLGDVQKGLKTYSVGTIYVDGPEAPQVSTLEASDTTATSVHIRGEVTDGGKAAVVARGFCYATHQYPTVGDSRVTVSGGMGVYEATLRELTHATTYYVRAYAENSVGVGYGQQIVVTTRNGLPTVTTAAINEIGTQTAVSGGEVIDNGGFAVTARGVCWSITPQPTVSNSRSNNGSGTGAFTSNISGLHPSTTYYLRAYATNMAGTVYGEERQFTTLSGSPMVETVVASAIGSTTAATGGRIDSDGGFAITARGVCYSTSPNPTINSPHTTDGIGTGSFVSQLSGLVPSTTYYYRAYATNASTTAYGEEHTFTTTE